jgi:hypothetical protein
MAQEKQDRNQESEYDAPGIGTVAPLRSKFAGDVETDLVKKVGGILQERGLIGCDWAQPVQTPIIIKLRDYIGKRPVRMHSSHWVRGSSQIAILHPETYLPFFLNPTGSDVCELCDGEHTVKEIIDVQKMWWSSVSEKILVEDLLKFLLLLEELGLIEFKERLL